MNYYEILPLKKTGEESRTFTYQSNTPLNIGSMVQVPLKSRRVRGIVVEKVPKPKYICRDIIKILAEEEILSKNQIEIAKKISEYYICSLGETINAYLPFDLGKKRRKVDISNNRSPASGRGGQNKSRSKIDPNKDQKEIIQKIQREKAGTTHLIHGVTGSGKTEIYLQLVAQALKEGKGSIILVPEIALTPQTFARFEERFGDQVAIWHSDLKETEKYATWEKIKSGEKMVVLGARSAIFMPVKNLTYIIIDEEHESSYKQDQNPRYDARLVAEWMADLMKLKLILGTATPRVESYYKSQNSGSASTEVDSGGYKYYSMNNRIVQESMPPVEVIDLRDEFRKGNKSIVSDALFEAITDTLKAKKQVMILLNRRGAATFVVCRDCGYVETCPNCEIPLTYHPSEGQILKCHHCDYRKTVPTTCPECQSMAIKFFGLGTQRAELEIQKLFPAAKIARMDHDTTQKRGSHETIYHDFLNEKFDILIGTQMIAKGWDLPNVELVGVISADTMINLPDFRSAERTFSLLTQVAGRTGRGYHPGKVIIQTYNPDNYAIVAASKHDYQSFYDQEIESRRKYGYPPYSKLIRLVYSHSDPKKAQSEAQRLYEAITKKIGEGIIILGPSPCFIEKLAGKYRHQLVIKVPIDKYQESNTKSQTKFQISNFKFQILDVLRENIKPGWTIDVDPESLL